MSIFLEGIIKIGKYDLNDLNKLIDKLNHNQLESHNALLNFLKKPFSYQDEETGETHTFNFNLHKDIEHRIYHLEQYSYNYSSIEEEWKKTSNVDIIGKIASFTFSKNFCNISYYGFRWGKFLDFYELREHVRNFSREIAKVLKGSSILYVPDSAYSASGVIDTANENKAENMEDLINELKQNNVPETSLDTYFYGLYVDNPFYAPDNTYFLEYL